MIIIRCDFCKNELAIDDDFDSKEDILVFMMKNKWSLDIKNRYSIDVCKNCSNNNFTNISSDIEDKWLLKLFYLDLLDTTETKFRKMWENNIVEKTYESERLALILGYLVKGYRYNNHILEKVY